jgi:hypothetical protein
MTKPDETFYPTRSPAESDAARTAGDTSRLQEPNIEESARTLGASDPGSAFRTLAAHIRRGDYRAVRLETGARVHHYEITDWIGRGGMSQVFGARHVYLGQQVALKTLLDESEDSGSESAERFLREAQTLAKLAHPNVVQVFDANVWNSVPYLITERLRGRDLSEDVSEFGPMSIDRALGLIEDVANVLVRQEAVGVLHRDIKPNNLHVRDDGSVCVFDYGLVGFDGAVTRSADDEATKAGNLIGTPAYMAPEQFAGVDVGPWSDIYGLGGAVWYALTGEAPRSGSNLVQLAQDSQRAPRSVRELRSDVPAELDGLVTSMLQPDRHARYSSASDLLRDVCNLRYRGRRVHGATRGRAFIAMPFSQSFESVWGTLEDACIDARLRPLRVDRMVYIENIWAQIVQEIASCSVLIADFTGGWLSRAPNANVITEAAHAVAVNRPVIVISQSPPESLPFDWRHVPVIRYKRSRAGLLELRRVLTERLQQVGRGARAS